MKLSFKNKLMLTFALLFASIPVSAFASSSDVSVTLDGKTTTFSSSEILRIAELNNVNADALTKSIEKGADEEGRFSPFSKLTPNKKGIKQTTLDENNKKKLSSTGEVLLKPKYENSSISAMGYIGRSDQDSTAYNWTGNPTASGVYPYLGIVAVHRNIDIGGSGYGPVIPFGSNIYLDRWVWLPDGVGYKSNFVVKDTGSGPGRTAYWIDVYYHIERIDMKGLCVHD
jgi:hypothetical protein